MPGVIIDGRRKGEETIRVTIQPIGCPCNIVVMYVDEEHAETWLFVVGRKRRLLFSVVDSDEENLD